MIPENLSLANTYIETSSIEETAHRHGVSTEIVAAALNTKPVRDYITEVYLDTGYRNRFKLANLLDDIINKKVAEAMETDFYTKADLLELMQFAHKLRMDEIKAGTPASQTNVQINNEFGQGNYAELMKKLTS